MSACDAAPVAASEIPTYPIDFARDVAAVSLLELGTPGRHQTLREKRDRHPKVQGERIGGYMSSSAARACDCQNSFVTYTNV